MAGVESVIRGKRGCEWLRGSDDAILGDHYRFYLFYRFYRFLLVLTILPILLVLLVLLVLFVLLVLLTQSNLNTKATGL